ncbi:MAG: class IV adenylate cyclase [Bryobacteraceae bacterium]
MTNGNEVEVKIRLASVPAIIDRLRHSGFSVSVPRQFEANTLYDTQHHSLRKQEMLLRLRQIGEKGAITWKGPGDPGPYKSRPELETTVGSVEKLAQILAQLGFQPSFRYEKYRTEFLQAENARGTVTLDETPIGDFLELEGPGDWIDAAAKQLGFSRQDYVLDSYARLYLADCERRGVEPSNMVFPSHSK